MSSHLFSKIWIVVILVIFIVGGIFAWQYFGSPEEKAETPAMEMEKITEDETADWKTYRNEEYGFEIRHPKEWTVVGMHHYQPPLAIKDIVFGPVGGGGFTVVIQIFTEFSSLDEWADEQKKFGKLLIKEIEKNIEKITVNGEEGYRITYIQNDSVSSIGGGFFEKGRLYYIEWDNPESLETFNQMLSTFRFLE